MLVFEISNLKNTKMQYKNIGEIQITKIFFASQALYSLAD